MRGDEEGEGRRVGAGNGVEGRYEGDMDYWRCFIGYGRRKTGEKGSSGALLLLGREGNRRRKGKETKEEIKV